MGHRINEWIGRLTVPAFVVASFVMVRLGVGVWRTVTILLPIFALLMLVIIFADPGPKAKGFVEALKGRLR